MLDEITFAAPTGDRFGTEILITNHAVSGRNRYFYRAPIAYVTQPKPDERNEPFRLCEIQAGALAIRLIFLPSELSANTSMASQAAWTAPIAPVPE